MAFFDNLKSSLHNVAEDLKNPLHEIKDKIEQGFCIHTAANEESQVAELNQSNNRFNSFAPRRLGNNAKWYVDACGYMWAVSVAIEQARESIWILDWWLSPELYLRRPPSSNEDYRLDRMLIAAAKRGVKINVIVYKEVSAILTLCSKHTKDALEVSPNISVFRHPDHSPNGQAIESELLSKVKNFSFNSLQLANLPGDAFKTLYGVNEDIVLYWAHHEKLCLVDGKEAFMGGLDLCFGRWDTNSHPLADAHPTDVDKALFPGQDYNNARVLDFEDVTNFMNNKLDRTKTPRMGWSDVSICLSGPVVEDLKAHFVQRWNFIFQEKYLAKDGEKYAPLTFKPNVIAGDNFHPDGTNATSTTHTFVHAGENDDTHRTNTQGPRDEGDFNFHSREMFNRFRGKLPPVSRQCISGSNDQETAGSMSVQLIRSCTKWSNGSSTEHSIANAYIEVIRQSQHFVYIENQFFITATDDNQHPVRNQIGAAVVERIVRAHQEGQNYKIIVCIPSIPAFAGDLHADDSLGTRAIMEFQYNSICRGGHSIMEKIEKAGVLDAEKYIRFYNLRNFDRINTGSIMTQVEQRSGVGYEAARKAHDDMFGSGYDGAGEGTGKMTGNSNYDRYQRVGSHIMSGSRYDSISECYMDAGPSVIDMPWSGTPEAEFDAYVSEELYIHSKLLIADDRIVICGSANLNDRSQLGYHDSEIAVVIEDPTPVESVMDGRVFQASAYATSLRRQLFRKHLGLLPAQDPSHVTANFLPLRHGANYYDWNSPADRLVRDVMTVDFERLWNDTARVNTAVFAKAFHVVPSDNCRTWMEYERWFQELFVGTSTKDAAVQVPPRYQYGHVVREEFPGGVLELKQWLARVRGSLVEMPLRFMEGEDFARCGLKLNALTQEVYT